MNQPGNIKRVVFRGENIGTTVSNNIEERNKIMANAIVEKTKREMTQSHQSLAREFGGIRAGRANANLLDRIHVEYYGVETLLTKSLQLLFRSACFVGNTIWQVFIERHRTLGASDLGIG